MTGLGQDLEKKKSDIKKFLVKNFDRTNSKLRGVEERLEGVEELLQENILYRRPPVPCHYKEPTPDCDCGCNPDSDCGKDCDCDCNPDSDNDDDSDDDDENDVDKDCTGEDDCRCWICKSYDVDEEEVVVEKVSRVMMPSDNDDDSDDDDEDSDDDDDSDDDNDWNDEDFIETF